MFHMSRTMALHLRHAFNCAHVFDIVLCKTIVLNVPFLENVNRFLHLIVTAVFAGEYKNEGFFSKFLMSPPPLSFLYMGLPRRGVF